MEFMGKKLPNVFFAKDGRGGATAVCVESAFIEKGSQRVVVVTGAGTRRYATEHEKPLRKTIKEALADGQVTA